MAFPDIAQELNVGDPGTRHYTTLEIGYEAMKVFWSLCEVFGPIGTGLPENIKLRYAAAISSYAKEDVLARSILKRGPDPVPSVDDYLKEAYYDRGYLARGYELFLDLIQKNAHMDTALLRCDDPTDSSNLLWRFSGISEERRYIYLAPPKNGYRQLHIQRPAVNLMESWRIIVDELTDFRKQARFRTIPVRGITWLGAKGRNPFKRLGWGQEPGVEFFSVDVNAIVRREKDLDPAVPATLPDVLKASMLAIKLSPANTKNFILNGQLPDVGVVTIPPQVFRLPKR